VATGSLKAQAAETRWWTLSDPCHQASKLTKTGWLARPETNRGGIETGRSGRCGNAVTSPELRLAGIRDMPLEAEAVEQCLLHHPSSAHHRPRNQRPAPRSSRVFQGNLRIPAGRSRRQVVTAIAMVDAVKFRNSSRGEPPRSVTQSPSAKHRLNLPSWGEGAAGAAMTGATGKIEAVIQRQVRIVIRHVVECAR
jgi:hypothetical protein